MIMALYILKTITIVDSFASIVIKEIIPGTSSI